MRNQPKHVSVGGHNGVRRMVALGAVGTVVAGLVSGPAAFAANSATHARPGFATVSRAPRLPHGARMTGATSSGTAIHGAIALEPRNPQALLAAATAASSPRSATYRQFIPKGAFASQYGATSGTIDAVKAALGRAHLSVTNVSRNRLMVRFHGTAGNAETAFRTHLANFRMPDGSTGHATTTAVSFPASIAGQVQAVVGLNTLLKPTASLRHATHPAAIKATAPPHPLSAISGAPKACAGALTGASEFGGLTDEQIANAYGAGGLYKVGDTGAGQRVGIVEFEPYARTDLKAFDTCYYGSTKASTMLTHTVNHTIDGGPGTGPGPSGEAILDIEDVEGIAPGAGVDVYQAPNNTPAGLDVYEAMINNDQDSVLSTSWGFCELDSEQLQPGYTSIENTLFEQAALQGQTLFSFSSDAGSDGCAYFNPTPVQPYLSTSDPATQPFVTSVGGTTISDATSPPRERVWNDGAVGGAGGGGVSNVWGAPAWQVAADNSDHSAVTHAVADGLEQCPEASSGGLCRQVPDVTAVADEYTGGITIFANTFGGWTTIGGTSSSTPLWAAMTALINASPRCAASTQPLGGVGMISPALYAVAAVPSQYAASFHDITAGNNDMYDVSNGQDFKATAGFDMASGLGSPILTHSNGSAGLASYLCAAGSPAPARPAITSVSPTVIPVGPTSGTLTITGTGFANATRVAIGGYNVPVADLTVTSTEIDVTPTPTAAQVGVGPQDGAGRYLVFVTGSDGVTSFPDDTNAAVLYVDQNSGNNVPSVSGTSPYAISTSAASTQVTVLGSNFNDGTPTVTVGGVAATVDNVVNDHTMKVTVPAYSNGTTTCETAIDTGNDGCQTQLVVTNANGSSPTQPVYKPLTGEPFIGESGFKPLPDCVTDHSCEIVPSTTEFDYLVPPHISSFSPSFVSEDPDNPTIGTITGKGFDWLGMNWVNIGPANDPASADIDITSINPTELQFTVTGSDPSTSPVTKQLSVQTLQGLSNVSSITYAGIPKVSSVTPRAGVDTGGTHYTISGKGFVGIKAADGGSIQYVYPDFGIASLQLSGYSANASGTSITGTTPANNPGQFIVEVCTITLCSEPQSQSQFDASIFDFFDPGDPVVTGLSKKSGPASGGNRVVITGRNLSDVVAVHFGARASSDAVNAPQLLTNGSNTEIDTVAPPGRAGSTVDVVVTTVESLHGGHPSAKHSVDRYTYQASVPSAPRAIKVIRHGTSPTVRWTKPLSNGGSRILRYRVIAHALKNSQRHGAKAPKDVVVVTKTGKVRSARLKGLKAGWFYVFKVRAVNKRGVGLTGDNGNLYLISQPAR